MSRLSEWARETYISHSRQNTLESGAARSESDRISDTYLTINYINNF